MLTRAMARLRFGDAIDQMTERERALLLAFGTTFLAMVTLLFGWLIWGGLTDIAERNEEMGQALRDIEVHGDEYAAKRVGRKQMERQMRPPPSLLGYLEEAAQGAGVSIPESAERPVQEKPGGYQENAVDIKLRKVTLGPLIRFLEKVESGPYLVVTTQFSSRSRYGKHEELDVEATFSTYEKSEEPPKGKDENTAK